MATTAPRKSYEGERVRIADLSQETRPTVLQDFEFDKCLIVGPAVLLLIDYNEFPGCDFTNGQASLIPIEADRDYAGVIGVSNCSFRECTFQNVALAAPRETLQPFLEEG